MDRLIIGGVCATGNKRSFEARSEADPRLAHDPLRVLSQPTLWGHASRVPGRGWRGVLRPPSIPPKLSAETRFLRGCGPASPRLRSIVGQP